MNYSTDNITESATFFSTVAILNMLISQSLLLSFLPPLSLSVSCHHRIIIINIETTAITVISSK